LNKKIIALLFFLVFSCTSVVWAEEGRIAADPNDQAIIDCSQKKIAMMQLHIIDVVKPMQIRRNMMLR
jgi:hypothetical protein